ncbi:MAG: gamma-glutamylcyclotransferase family protein [Cyanobacteria bacterium J06626_18]
MIQVFVYGTLKPGEAYYAEYCEPYVVEAVPAIAQGHLFHLPMGYPAMTLGEGYVTGALLQLKDEGEIAHMDDFEDYDPALPEAENLYLRQLRPVFSLEHQPLGQAWMYMMLLERVQQYQGIPVSSGNWSRQQWPSI